MAIFTGTLVKMETQFSKPIQYYLVFENEFIHINSLLGKSITLKHEGYECLNCKKAKKIWRQGFCFDCFNSSPAAADWIIRPELSKAHLDLEDRDLDYEKKVQLQPHIVYLALSSDIKVGVTRSSQVPTRWIDQGASKALKIVEVPNRYLAGITEVALKAVYTDKTSWQKMLKNDIISSDLTQEIENVKSNIPEAIMPFLLENEQEITLDFPVNAYPEKVSSLNLEKTKEFTGVLQGIKGQYLIFEDGTVFNVRTYEGYKVALYV